MSNHFNLYIFQNDQLVDKLFICANSKEEVSKFAQFNYDSKFISHFIEPSKNHMINLNPTSMSLCKLNQEVLRNLTTKLIQGSTQFNQRRTHIQKLTTIIKNRTEKYKDKLNNPDIKEIVTEENSHCQEQIKLFKTSNDKLSDVIGNWKKQIHSVWYTSDNSLQKLPTIKE
jgi:hypothetical protein